MRLAKTAAEVQVILDEALSKKLEVCRAVTSTHRDAVLMIASVVGAGGEGCTWCVRTGVATLAQDQEGTVLVVIVARLGLMAKHTGLSAWHGRYS
jgi:hypothetical protein